MNWYFDALTAAVAGAGQFLCMKRLQKTYPIEVYMAYVWLGAGIMLGILFVRSTEYLTIVNCFLLVVAALASWGGMYAYNLAIKQQSNIGYIESISSARVAIVYLVSLLCFDAVFELTKLTAVVGTSIGALMVIGFRSTKQVSGKIWALWAALAGAMFALLIICSKLATMQGVDVRVFISILFLIAGLIYAGSAIWSGASFKPSGDVFTLLLAVFFAALSNVALFTSYSTAPNLAYPTAINNGRMVLLYLAALISRSDRLEIEKAFGVALTFVCVALLG